MSLVQRIGVALLAFMAFTVPAMINISTAEGADWNHPSRIYKPNNGWVAMYGVPRVTNYPTTWLQSGKAFYMDCWIDNQYWNGNYGSARWFAGWGGGYYGYVHSSYVTYQTWVPHC